ncbi:cystathionine beta-lyase [Silvibacterium sp.]|uniref:cystathionine beta-lyase n=1 Tax=Silvibacterium sp. TaxID=1964179 RepID=UPI0039E64952
MTKIPNQQKNWRSRLMHPERRSQCTFESLAVPTHRGSTVVFPSQEEVREGWRTHAEQATYGIYGTPTALELGERLAEIEGAHRTFLTPSGQSAIALVYLAVCHSGSHVLVPSTAYGPNKDFGLHMMRRFGITAELYDPLIGEGIAALIRPDTSLIWCESPGSITMEIQDVPALVKAARSAGVLVASDNTYSAGVFFDAFAHGVDISVQALTKYVGGHSDLMLGSVSVREEKTCNAVGDAHRSLGYSVSPDECSLALRGLQTLAVRLDAMEQSALKIAQWLGEQTQIARVLHPALPSCEGHEIWKRDFTGSTSVFSVIFDESISQEQVNRLVNSLTLYKIGWSWGGTVSLVMAYPGLHRPRYGKGNVVRFHIGLEDTNDLIADLKSAFSKSELL